MCIHELSYKQFCDLVFGFIEHVDWDKTYVIVTHEMVIVNVDAYIIHGIGFDFNKSQHVVGLSQISILMDLTCLIALIMIPLSTRWI